MRKFIYLGLIIIVLISLSSSTSQFSKIENTAYKRGEKLKYSVYYNSMITGNVTAGELTTEITKDSLKFSNRPTYHIQLIGKSAGTFNWFMKVRDSYETWIDEDAQIPWYFRNRVQEGDYKASKDIAFYHHNKQAKYINNKNKNTSMVDIPQNIQDMISAIYYARNIDFSNAKVGTKYPINFMFDDSVYQTQLEYVGLVFLTTKIGKIECLKFKPRVLSGGVFKDETPLTLYVTNDKNRIPVFAESEIIVGSVRMELVEYSGLKNPFSSIKAKRKN